MIVFPHSKKGFTLLETLASVSILSLVIIGPLSVTISSSGYARLTKDTIVATYLAEEAMEMLQNQYDSLYVYCNKFPTATDSGALCDKTSTADATAGQTAWRLFKNRLATGNGQTTTCYVPKDGDSYPGGSAGNANGCAFDFKNLMATSTEPLVRYDAASENCKYLVPVSTSTLLHTQIGRIGLVGGNDTEAMYSYVRSTSTSYVCKGVSAHVPAGGKVQAKEFIRSITIEQMPTYETGAQDAQYNDDIRITSNVQFKALNGVSHNVKITRFMHARP